MQEQVGSDRISQAEWTGRGSESARACGSRDSPGDMRAPTDRRGTLSARAAAAAAQLLDETKPGIVWPVWKGWLSGIGTGIADLPKRTGLWISERRVARPPETALVFSQVRASPLTQTVFLVREPPGHRQPWRETGRIL